MSKLILWVVMAALFVAGCGGGSSSSSGGGGGGGGSSITIAISPKTYTLAPLDELQFHATVTGATNAGVTWTASGGSIDATGRFTAPGLAGAVTVTAASIEDSTKTASATVTVVTGVIVRVSPTSATVAPGATKQFTATVTGGSSADVTWTATRGTITDAGLYTAPATEGADVVKATSKADTTRFASAEVTVQAAGSGVSVSISPSSTSLGTGEAYQFTAAVTGATDTSVTWSATSGTILADGSYTAPLTAGTDKVTVTSVADPTKKASATIVVNAVSVTVTAASSTVDPGGQVQMTAVVSGARDRSVTWTSSAGSVSSTGLFTAPTTSGDVTITATSKADTRRSARTTVTVVVPSSYSFNFDNGIPSFFDNTSKAAESPNSVKYWGPFTLNSNGTLTLPGLKAHQKVVVTFDLYCIDDWQGTDRNHKFTVKVDGTSVKSTSFSNGTSQQNYPDDFGGTKSAAGTGKSASNTLGYVSGAVLTYQDTTYHLSYTVAHTASTLTVEWVGSLDSGPFWGIDNVQVDLQN